MDQIFDWYDVYILGFWILQLCSACMDELAPQMLIHQDRQNYVAKFETEKESHQRDEDEELLIVQMLSEMPLQQEYDWA